ncbi:MAG: hypothetical protein JWN07_280 [Hyphomicrobiales bacterium]|nr:hypothetical protein [Hyphomicrobiales bacterium]
MHRMSRAVSLCLALAALSTPAFAQGAETPYVEVSGSARGEVAFDRAIVPFTLRNEAASAEDAARDLAEKSRQVVDALSQIGVGDPNLRINGPLLSVIYNNVTEEQGGRKVEKSTPAGIRGEVSFRVTTTDFKKIPKILAAATGAGALVSSPTFEVANLAEQRARLGVEAVRTAVARAKQLAEAAGARTGRILSIVDERGGRQPMEARTLAMASDAAPEIPVLPGRAMLEHVVTVRVELAQP